MKILEFNRKSGIYHFQLEGMETGFHAHPAVEMVFCKSGQLEVETPNSKHQGISFAIMEANMPHRIKSEGGDMVLLMLECSSAQLHKGLAGFGITLEEGIFLETSNKDRTATIEEISHLYRKFEFPGPANEVVQKCLHYLNSSASEYQEMLTVLRSETNLSNSRLSHLFKNEMGISLKKYLVWSKLKRAFEAVVYSNKNMYESSLESGFYDQAHLSKAFRQMLGINPSEVYNSRTLQV